MNIVLLEPEIPYNTGNIGRTCAAAGVALHLIRPFGFVLDDRHVKRAGLDYWGGLDVREYDDFEDFLRRNPNVRLFLATTKAKKHYAQARFEKDDFIMFGKESAGIPEEIIVRYSENALRIPMREGCRSLNLSCAVAIVLYEALRQQDFYGLEREGALHRLQY